MQLFNFDTLRGILFLLAELVVFSACLYYFSKRKTGDSILLCIGSFISVCVLFFYQVLWPILQSTGNSDLFYGNSLIFSLVGTISFVGVVLFTIGFFMLVVRVVKNK